MGNTQSSEEPVRRPMNKLSKPRTNSSSNLLALAGQTPNPSTQTLQTNVSEQTARPMNKRTSTMSILDTGKKDEKAVSKDNESRPKSSRRRSLFRSKSANPEKRTSLPTPEPQQIVHEEFDSQPVMRYTKQGATSQQYFGPSQHSNYDPRSLPPPNRRNSSYVSVAYQREQARLSVIQSETTSELHHFEGVPHRPLSHIEDTQNEQFPSPNSGVTSSDELNSFPIRRRSLMTPGIATRKNSVNDDPDTSRHSSISQHNSSSFAPEDNYTSYEEPPKIPTRAHTVSSTTDYQSYYYDQSKPTESPLEQIAALSHQYIGPRTETPCEEDYRHIGNLKLGSLRITNGAASPAFSVAKSRETSRDLAATVKAGSHGSYFTARQEGEFSDEEIVYRRRFNTETSRWVKFKESKLDLKEPKDAMSEEESVYRRRFDTESGHFVTYMESQNTSKTQYSDQHNPTSKFVVAPEKLSLRPPQKDRSLADPHQYPAPEITTQTIEVTEEPQLLHQLGAVGSIHRKFDKSSPTRSRDMANAYMSEIASSPFSFDHSEPPSPKLEATSKHTAQEDLLFDDDVASRMSIISNSSTPRPVVAKKNSKSSMNNHSASGNKIIYKISHDLKLKPLTKADSGYSSTTSLKASKSTSSLRREAAPGPEVPDKNPPPTPPKNSYSRSSSDSTNRRTIVPRFSWTKDDEAPETPEKDVLSPRDAYMMRVESMRREELKSKPPTRQAPIPPVKDTPVDRRASESEAQLKMVANHKRDPIISRQSLPAVPTKHKHSSSESDASLSSSTKKKLFKFRADPQQEVTVQRVREITPSVIIPWVSPEASARLEERITECPPLTHTYKTVSKTNSKETLATFMTTDTESERMEAEYQDQIDKARYTRFQGPMPDTPAFIEIEKTLSNDLAKESWKRESSPHSSRKSVESTRSKRSSFQIIPRKSIDSSNSSRQAKQEKAERRRSWLEEKNQEAFEAHITSFGTVSQSLGASPYDVAMGTLSNPLPQQSAARSNMFHIAPHSLGSGRGRIHGMDATVAAQFARDRSEKRRADQKRQTFDAQPLQRSFNDRGGIPGSLIRPNSLVLDGEVIPPVPALPSSIPNSSSFVMGEQKGQPKAGVALPKKTRSPPPVSMANRKALPNLPVNSNVNNLGNAENLWEPQSRQWAARRAVADARTSLQASASATKFIPPPQPHEDSTDISIPDPRSILPSQRRSSESWRPIPVSVPAPQPQRAQSQLPPEHSQHFRPVLSEERLPNTCENTRMSLPTQSRSFDPPKRASTSYIPAANNELWMDETPIARQPSLLARNSYESLSYQGAHPQMSSRFKAPTRNDSCIAATNEEQHTTDASWNESENYGGDENLVLDRYSGGLAYNYGSVNSGGFGPTQGPRDRHTRQASIDRLWGVDWSDVPVSAKRIASIEV